MRIKIMILLATLFVATVTAQCPPCTNQTDFFTAPLSESGLPFTVQIEEADFSLPQGLHSYVFATYQGEWLLLSGRTNGLHNVDNEDPMVNSFPVSNQNTVAYVVNPQTGTTASRSLSDPTSDLDQTEIDLLSVTNAVFYQTQNKKQLYVVGGYGTNSATGNMETKAAITAIDVKKFISWIKNPGGATAKSCMRFAYNPLLAVTGGVMSQANAHQPYLLFFGQNFQGYYLQDSNGTYPQKVSPCQIFDNGTDLIVQPYTAAAPTSVFRRRDLNVIPIIKKTEGYYTPAYVALSGVFTPGGGDTPGAWTSPIEIDLKGNASMRDPSQFSQAMNNYACPTIGLYSQRTNDMYTLLFGGISAVLSIGSGDCSTECQSSTVPTSGSNLIQCCNLPFTNDITTIRIDPQGDYSQFMMSAKYPTIDSGLTSNPCGGAFDGPRILWFGASAEFFPNETLPAYSNGVLAYDKIGSEPIFLGYITGGISSSLVDTNCLGDSWASTHIFKVTLIPK